MPNTTDTFNIPFLDGTELVRDYPTFSESLADAVDQGLSDVRGPVSNNAIINGDFGVWQRGTSFTGLEPYTADRWRTDFAGAPSSLVRSRQAFTPGEIPGTSGEFYFRLSVVTAGPDAVFCDTRQRIEDVRTFGSGNKVTISFYAKADSNRIVTAALNRNFGSGGSTEEGVIGADFNLSSSWQRFTLTATTPSLSGKTIGSDSYLDLFFRFATNVSGATFDLWGVQVEAGPVATPFRLAGGGSKAAELALCQRYFNRLALGSEGAGNFVLVCHGQAFTTTDSLYVVRLQTNMRTAPSLSVSSVGHFVTSDAAFSNLTLTALSISGQSTTNQVRLDSTVASGLVAGNVTTLFTNDAAGTLDLSAEL